MATRVGVVSDTHGLVRREALEVLSGVSLIVHAGDVGGPDVLSELGEIAPVFAVRGNNDRSGWAKELPLTEVVEVEDALLYVIHDRGELEIDPSAAGFQAVISGHSHWPGCEVRGGVLHLNPGSVGPRRFKLPISLALLEIDGARLRPEMIELEVSAARPGA